MRPGSIAPIVALAIAACSPGPAGEPVDRDAGPSPDSTVRDAGIESSPERDSGWPSATQMNTRLGRGINMANMLETSTPEMTQRIEPQHFQDIRDAGFDHVRIPVKFSVMTEAMPPVKDTWKVGQGKTYQWNADILSCAAEKRSGCGSRPCEDYCTLDATPLGRVETVVQQALAAGLIVILDFHHYKDAFEDLAHMNRHRVLWQQIADRFSGYGPDLLFELLNEPTGKLSDENEGKTWSDYAAQLLPVIRARNPERTLIVGPTRSNHIEALVHFRLPEDSRLIVTLHSYAPVWFTMQGAGQYATRWCAPNCTDPYHNKWPHPKLEAESAWVRSQPHLCFTEKRMGEYLQLAADWSRAHGDVPIHFGEFGTNRGADPASRVRWAAAMRRQLEQRGFSWSYWGLCSDFGIYSCKTKDWSDPEILAALVGS